MDLIDELSWRGMLHQGTDLEGLRAHLANPSGSPRRIYAGFDPTADSLTIGNLVPIMLLKHVQRSGHTPVVVMGGGTGLIGDPSGKSAERQLMTPETVDRHIGRQRPIFSRILGDDVTILNNAEWLANLGYLEALRDIGKFFSVNMMIQKDSVRSRLQDRDHGISYTEFSYMILQAYDFMHLYQNEGVSIQCGGSDQFGNIVSGIDLIRRRGAQWHGEFDTAYWVASEGRGPDEAKDAAEGWLHYALKCAHWFLYGGNWLNTNSMFKDAYSNALKKSLAVHPRKKKKYTSTETSVLLSLEGTRSSWDAYGFTAPLISKSDGTKFGKTESGAIWLTAERTSPYAYYQFWLNAADADVGRFLRTFTLLEREEIERLERELASNPGAREAQKRLAYEATSLLHGPAEADAAVSASQALFSGDISSLPEATLRQVLAEVPSTERDRSGLDAGVDVTELLVELGLATSKRQSREFLESGSVSVNGVKIDAGTRLTSGHLLHGSMVAIRRGKKSWHLVIWK